MLKNWVVDHNNESSVTHKCRVKTNEDWHPTKDGELTMSVIKYDLNDNIHKLNRICIWGADDFGMERDFEDATFIEMKEIADAIPEPVAVEWLQAHGFIRA